MCKEVIRSYYIYALPLTFENENLVHIVNVWISLNKFGYIGKTLSYKSKLGSAPRICKKSVGFIWVLSRTIISSPKRYLSRAASSLMCIIFKLQRWYVRYMYISVSDLVGNSFNARMRPETGRQRELLPLNDAC